MGALGHRERPDLGGSVTDIVNTGRGSWSGYQGVAIVAFFVLALTIIKPINIAAAVAATGLLVASRAVPAWKNGAVQHTRKAALVSAVLFLAMGLAAWQLDPLVARAAAVLLPFAAATGYLVMKGSLEARPLRLVAAGLLVIMVLAVGFVRIIGSDPPLIDVYDLHISAADSLLDLENPYTETSAPDTRPNAPPGSVWEGYPYPPLTLIAYTGAYIVLGDPRWMTVIAVAIAVVLMVQPWAILGRAHAAALVAVALALATQPLLGYIVRSAWTDALALPFLAAAGVLWRKNPAMAAIALGLALGTKQYFVLVLPLLLVWSDDFRWKRAGIAGSVAFLSVLPAFVVDAQGAWDALVVAHLETTLRLDSIGLAGFGWHVPTWLVIAATITTALWMGWRGGLASRFLIGLAATLGVTFMVGSQAFLNYWFIVGAVAVVAVASDEHLALTGRASGVGETAGEESAARG